MLDNTNLNKNRFQSIRRALRVAARQGNKHAVIACFERIVDAYPAPAPHVAAQLVLHVARTLPHYSHSLFQAYFASKHYNNR